MKIPIKNNWYNWLTNFIPGLVREGLSGFKNKVVSPFKTNISDDDDKQIVWSGKNLAN